MLPSFFGARPLEELREEARQGRRVPLGRRRLAQGETDLALRHRHARQGIHEEEDVARRRPGNTPRWPSP